VLVVTILAAGPTACDSPKGRSAETTSALPETAATAEVTNNYDAGPGSFRAAVLEANGDPSIRSIRFRPRVGGIELASTVLYTGSQSLHIDGQGARLAGTPGCDCDLLLANGGGDLALSELTIENSLRSGIVVVVPPGATGVLEVSLRKVVIRNNGLHGLAVDDQVGDDGTGADSESGIHLDVDSSMIAGNGFRAGFSDFDGIRIDEGGNGDLRARVHDSRFVENAGDGLELDERGPGSAVADVGRTAFDRNGRQPQNPEDLEDGFDIDEADEGDIVVSIVHSTASGNFDEGVDLGEEGPGNIRFEATRLVASGNVDEGIKVSEDAETEAGGDIDVELQNVTASNSQEDDGMHFEEFGPGDLEARVLETTIRDNAAYGINVDQTTPGEGKLGLEKVTFGGNGDDDVDATEVEVIQLP
jgi:hypothetical protein